MEKKRDRSDREEREEREREEGASERESKRERARARETKPMGEKKGKKEEGCERSYVTTCVLCDHKLSCTGEEEREKHFR